MKSNVIKLIAIITIFSSFTNIVIEKIDTQEKTFNISKDLLLLHFDCKTDVDDLQTVAAFATLVTATNFKELKYHAVAGAYGIQEGLYVPPNELFQLAFDNNWTDAHNNSMLAVKQVMAIIKPILYNQGDIWIAEAGQSDVTAKLVKAIQIELPEIDTSKRIHVVQHSDWNEEVTSAESLEFVKNNTDYNKIPDGNAVGNGTPGFRDPNYTIWENTISNPKMIEIWQLSINLSTKYNGKEGRYNNEAIASGGLDFSDLAEVCWILDLQHIKNTEQFFALYLN